MILHACDRCSASMTDWTRYARLSSGRGEQSRWTYDASTDLTSVELCAACADELQRWLTEVPKKPVMP
jgi:hypothetical protein